jgi:hypothetical protein
MSSLTLKISSRSRSSKLIKSLAFFNFFLKLSIPLRYVHIHIQI